MDQQRDATNLFFRSGEYTLLLASHDTAERLGRQCVRVEPAAVQEHQDWVLEVAPDGRVLLAQFKAPYHDDHDVETLGDGVRVTFLHVAAPRTEEVYPGVRLYRHPDTGMLVGADLTRVCR